jgi:LemA protein
MKKYLKVGIGVFIGLLLFMNGCTSFNTMGIKEEKVEQTWGDVQTQYQRRSDLIPKLVKVLSANANFEKSTLTDVINARANATKIVIDPSKLNAQSLQQFDAAQSQVSNSLSRLLVSVEKYPDLKASAQFIDLQAEISGTENRITIVRKDFNSTVNDFNSYIKVFPKNIWAKSFGFSRKDYFKANSNAQDSPDINFDIK